VDGLSAWSCPGVNSSWDRPSTFGRSAGNSLHFDLTSPVFPEGMAGDAALSARLRVTPLRSRHEHPHPRPDESGTNDGPREEAHDENRVTVGRTLPRHQTPRPDSWPPANR
jgi:hypothetical protein